MSEIEQNRAGDPVLSMKGICKFFPGVKALDNVQLELRSGEVHALMGENGAGKSTLMKILTGVYRADEGQILIDGKDVQPRNPLEATELGITIIHQELNQVLEMTVAENFFLGRERFKQFGLLRRGHMDAETERWTRQLGMNISARSKLCELSVAARQMLEIAKAISNSTRVLVMDEPTTALSSDEVKQLFAVVRQLRSDGVAVVYISHRMEEVFELCDRVTVLRDGTFVTSAPIQEMTRDKLIAKMVGRELTQLFPPGLGKRLGAEVLKLRNFGILPSPGRCRVEGVSLEVRAGEIVGLAGLMGAGRTELLEGIYGVAVASRISGEIWVGGKRLAFKSPRDAIQAGIGFVTEDRKGQSLSLVRPVGENASLVALKRFTRGGFLNLSRERAALEAEVRALRIKTPSLSTPVGSLSGGNQQKVVLAKYLLNAPGLYLLDEPTQGIDVGAKAEIYTLINELASRGTAVLMASSDMQELLAMSDRIVVLCEGRVSGELTRSEATQDRILDLATRFRTSEMNAAALGH